MNIRSMPAINAVFVSSVIAALRWILQLIQLFVAAIDKLQKQVMSSPTVKQGLSKTVVIVGGNFAGLAALWELLSRRRTMSNLKIILIDQRSYSEYTPGILRLFCEPDGFYNVVQPLPASNTYPNFHFIQGKVTSLVDRNNQKILTYLPPCGTTCSRDTPSKRPQQLRYDYVIVATGATYSAPISPRLQENAMTLENRFREWQLAHRHLDLAHRVLILGGGAVGVELAAEIVDHYQPNNNKYRQPKQVTLLDAQSSLVPNFPKAVGMYAQQWLEQRGVTIRLGKSWQSWTDTTCTLQDGTVLQADVVYVCFGSKPNSEFVVAPHQQEPNTKSQPWCSLTKRQTIVAQNTLQVLPVTIAAATAKHRASTTTTTMTTTFLSSNDIFVCGDVATPPSHDEKQAFQAEMQGKVAARNVLRLATTTSSSLSSSTSDATPPLYRYPNDVAGSSQMPLIFVLSLGKYDGVLGFNGLIVPGPMAAIVKWILEYTKVLQMRGDLLGKLIWKLGDAVVLFLSRTLILPSQSSTDTLPVQKRLKAA
jgi:NADH dehydrogenase FAD-containing subunit